MTVHLVSASEAIAQLQAFDTLIDARSEAEFAEDHLPGAVNWPTLDNEERKEIGTLYKQVNPFEARKRGAAMAARNIARHIERDAIDKPREWKPLAYCWRGGKRSGSLALILDQIGFRTSLIEGGYKAFRAAVVADIPARVAPLDLRVICGRTGAGKTRLLQALQAEGAQVIDLEALAQHRSSVLGAIPGVAQPTQKRFDTLVWDALRQLDPARPVFIESESKKVGNVFVPDSLVQKMRQSPCLNLELPMPQRVALLLEEYDYLARHPDLFCSRLDVLTELRGHAVITAWKAKVRAGDLHSVVQDLLVEHYDPVYIASMQRNFTQYDLATPLEPANHSLQAMGALARQMLAS